MAGQASRPKQDSRRQSEAAELKQSLQNFDSVIRRGDKIADKKHSDSSVFLACQCIGERIGIELKRSRHSGDEDDFSTALRHIANASKFRYRKIVLSDQWPRKDCHMLLGQLKGSGEAIAIEYTKKRGVVVYGPQDFDGGRRLDQQLMAAIEPVAYQLYAPLPDQVVSVVGLMTYGLTQHAPDALIYLLTMSLVSAIGFAIPMATGFIFNTVVPNYEQMLLVLVCLALLLAHCTTFAMNLASERAGLRLEGLIGSRMQAAILDRLLRLPHSFFGAYSTPDLMLRVNSVETTRRSLTSISLRSLNALFISFYGITLLFYYHPPAAWVALGMVLFMLLAANAIGYLGLKAFFQGERMTANVLSMVYQMVEAISLIRIFDAETRSFTRWADNYLNMRGRLVRSTQYENLYKVVQRGFDIIALAATFWVIMLNLDEADALSLGDFLAFVISFSMVLAGISQLTSNAIAVYRLVPRLKRVTPILETLPESTSAKTDPGTIDGSIDLVKVSFAYHLDKPPVIDDVSLSIAPGEYIGIIGTTGCGKSTLLRLMLGFLNPQQGRIYFGRQDIQLLDLELLRNQFGVVLQSNHLFAGTIYENIASGRDTNAAEVMAAVEAVSLSRDIENMPMGLNTVITESTTAFSGGQIQRIALARAILGNPKVLFLDEATSALDNLSQQRVTQTINQLECTRIIVAHRFITIRNCDRILVLDRGRIIQQGPFEELVSQKGLFRELARRQTL